MKISVALMRAYRILMWKSLDECRLEDKNDGWRMILKCEVGFVDG